MSIVHYGQKSKASGSLLLDKLTEAGYNGPEINYGLGHTQTALNKPEAIENACNKRLALQAMNISNVQTPHLRIVTDGTCYIPELQDDIAFIGRPDKHSKGRGFWMCRNVEDVQRALRGTRIKAAATHFLEYIEGAREFRVHVMRDHRACIQSECMNGECPRTGPHVGSCSADKYRSIKISEKLLGIQVDENNITDVTRAINTVQRNHDNGTVFNYTDISNRDRSSLRKAARMAVSALNLDFGAVDILLKDGKAYVLEVNTAPRLTDETSDTLQKYVEGFMRYWDE